MVVGWTDSWHVGCKFDYPVCFGEGGIHSERSCARFWQFEVISKNKQKTCLNQSFFIEHFPISTIELFYSFILFFYSKNNLQNFIVAIGCVITIDGNYVGAGRFGGI